MEDADLERVPGWLVDRMAGLDACDGYIVLIIDPQTAETDAHGPFDGVDVIETADRFRRDYDRAGLTDVQVLVTRLHGPRPALSLHHAA